MNLLAQAEGINATPFVFGGGMMLVMILLGLAALALWLWALIDAIRNPALDPTMRIVWILVIVLTSWIGALIYLAIGRNATASLRATSK
jgi:Phospholipase_D-nuclease N-terminal